MAELQSLLARVRNAALDSGHDEPALGHHRFITIMRDVGAMGDAVASELATRLRWHVFDREIVDFIAEDNHVRQSLVRDLDEKAQSLIHDTVERLLLMAEGISFGNEEYHRSLLRTLATLAVRGKSIIVGRGAVYALHGEPGLHIRLFASPEFRTERLAKRWLIPMDEARRRMEHIDSDRRSFIQHHFRRDIDDLHFYHAVFNTDFLSVDQVARSTIELMKVSEHIAPSGVMPPPAPGGDGSGPPEPPTE